MVEILTALVALMCIVSSLCTWYVCNFLEDVIDNIWEEEDSEDV